MKKKFFVACALTATVAIGAVSLTACGNNNTNTNSQSYSETYSGTVSTRSFASPTLAAKAYLIYEIECPSEKATMVSYEKKADLSKSEIDSLSLSEAEKASVVSAEKGTVAYTVSPTSTASSYAGENTLTYYKGVYILNMGETYKYYDPTPANGEALTNSYFESVFNSENYKNYTMGMKLISESSAQGQTMTITMDYTCKVTSSAVGITATTTAKMGTATQSTTIDAYIIEDKGTLKVVGGYNGVYSAMALEDLNLNITCIEDLASTSMPEYLDLSYFEKTGKGFKMKDSKTDEFLAKYIESNPAIAQYPITKMTASYDFGVSDGKLCEGSSACTINMTYEGVSVIASASQKYKYYNYGATTVTIPDAAKQVFING